MDPRSPPTYLKYIRRFQTAVPLVMWYMLRLLLQQVVDGFNPTHIDNKYEVNNPDTLRVKAVFEDSNDVRHMRDVIDGGYTCGYNFKTSKTAFGLSKWSKKTQYKSSVLDAFGFYTWWKTKRAESIVLDAYTEWKTSYVGPCSDSHFDLFEMSFISAIQQI